MIDATTAIEDKDFWTNPGFDPVGIVRAGLDTLAGRPRGASTITQQLVRARLLPAEAFEGSVVRPEDPRDHPVRSGSPRRIPGEEGKKKIMTAYLNQNFYGNQSYGVKAAAFGYFGKRLERADARPVRDPRRDPAVADQVRPHAATPSESATSRARIARTARTSSWSSRRVSEIVVSAATTSST